MILSKRHLTSIGGASWCLMLLFGSFILIEAQDLLRNTATHQQFQQQQQLSNANNQNNLNNNLLANIQLPPQLASLTPQQLHQLAQIREFQLQQEAAQRQKQQQDSMDQMSSSSMSSSGSGDQLSLMNGNHPEAPAPLGMENAASIRPTERPAGNYVADQIPQPNLATTSGNQPSAASDNNDRHDNDDGAYTESGSEIEGVSASGNGANTASAATSATDSSATPSSSAAPTFEVNWNKCPQLEPSESEKSKKTQVITKCLQEAPIPANLTRENVEAHREQIATCALKIEGWFELDGSYRYEKAEQEIRAKKLEPAIEIQVLKFHVACREESNKKFPRDQNKSLIDQVQFYQACMDYYISIVCEIEVSVDQ